MCVCKSEIYLQVDSYKNCDDVKQQQQQPEHNQFLWTSFVLCSSNMYVMVVHLDVDTGLD